MSDSSPTDTERLDWMEKSGARVYERAMPPDLPDEFRQIWRDRPFGVSTVKGLGWVGATLRDAIDTAAKVGVRYGNRENRNVSAMPKGQPVDHDTYTLAAVVE